MNVVEYERKISLYENFSKVVKDILKSAIDIIAEKYEHPYHLQQIQYRAKTVDSLSQRLKEINALDSKYIEDIRYDLAGCRIIFYGNDDVTTFLHSRIIYNNFTLYNIKFHGRGKVDPDVANEYYTANHYIVGLKDSRKELAEYSIFNNMKCEIQIQTTLNHAWAETTHDITYKNSDNSNYGRDIFDKIDKRLIKIKKQYLDPAGYEFQKIRRDYHQLLERKKFSGRDLFQEIINCKNNDECYEIMEH